MNAVRYIAFALIAMLCALTVKAQRMYEPDFSLGVKGGMTLSEMAWSPSVRQGMTQGVTVGVVARYTEENHFGIIGELNLTQRGWAESFKDDNPELSYSRHFTYIQLPVMTHIFFGSKKFRFFVNLGPEIGYMVGDKISANFDYANTASIVGFPANRRTAQLDMKPGSRFDYGIAAGIGGEGRFAGKHSVMIEGRFYYGIGNVFPAKRTDTFGASRGMSIEITAAYMFRLK